MDPATLTAVGLAVKEGIGTLSELIAWIRDGQKQINKLTPSLPAYTKQTNIMSRLYIEDNILRDDICVPLVGVLNQLYVSYILSALNIDTLCASGQTVRELLETVSSESYDLIHEIMFKFGSNNYNYSNEDVVADLEPATQRLPVGRLIELSLTGVTNISESTNRDVSSNSSGREMTSSRTDNSAGHSHTTGTNTTPITTTRTDKVDKRGNPITRTETKGGVTNIDTETDTDPTHSETSGVRNTSTSSTTKESGSNQRQTTFQFKAYIYVQMIPYVLNPDVVSGYIKANFDPPLSTRWQKYRAGEISFWNDFIFTRDLIKQQAKVLKQDKAGVITEMMDKNSGKLGRWLMGLIGIKPMSHNIANSILICNKETFTRACREVQLRFDNYDQRQKFFNKTWSMIICVVDTNYSIVEMYFNGLDCKGTYTFDMMNKVGAKGKDSFDLKEIMGAFSQGLSPRF